MSSMRIIITALLLVVLMTTSSEAGWLIYHKPEFKGRVLDTETKEPIEGAVVVVVDRLRKTTLHRQWVKYIAT